MDDAQGKDQAAEAQVEAAKAGLAAAQEHRSEATANRERVQSLFNYTKITAPFDGVVTQRYADTGAMLAAGTSSEQQALSLVKLSQNGLFASIFRFPRPMSCRAPGEEGQRGGAGFEQDL